MTRFYGGGEVVRLSDEQFEKIVELLTPGYELAKAYIAEMERQKAAAEQYAAQERDRTEAALKATEERAEAERKAADEAAKAAEQKAKDDEAAAAKATAKDAKKGDKPKSDSEGETK